MLPAPVVEVSDRSRMRACETRANALVSVQQSMGEFRKWWANWAPRC